MSIPSFQIKKNKRRLRDVLDFYMFAILLVVFTVLTVYTYQIQNPIFTAFLFVIFFSILINTGNWIRTYRRTLPSSFEVHDDRLVWSMKGRAFKTLELGPSIEVDLLLKDKDQPPALKNIKGYVMADDARHFIILDERWGWDIDDLHSFLPVLVGLVREHGFKTEPYMERYLATEGEKG